MTLIVANLIHGFLDPLKYCCSSIQGALLETFSSHVYNFSNNGNFPSKCQHEVEKQLVLYSNNLHLAMIESLYMGESVCIL